MTHSVSHQLILELIGDDLIVTTLKSDRQVVNIQLFSAINPAKLKEILSEMPDIYSDIILLIRKNKFIILPEIYYQTDYKDFFTLSHSLDNGDELNIDKSDHGFGIVYPLNIELRATIRNKFLRINQQNEVSLILNKIYEDINFKLPQLFIEIAKENLLIIAVNEGKLQLCNTYQVQNSDEIFYFVMLAIEQLQFLPIETELIILGKPVKGNELKELFKNYIPKIRIWSETTRVEKNLENEFLIENSFALQSILCE